MNNNYALPSHTDMYRVSCLCVRPWFRLDIYAYRSSSQLKSLANTCCINLTKHLTIIQSSIEQLSVRILLKTNSISLKVSRLCPVHLNCLHAWGASQDQQMVWFTLRDRVDSYTNSQITKGCIYNLINNMFFTPKNTDKHILYSLEVTFYPCNHFNFYFLIINKSCTTILYSKISVTLVPMCVHWCPVSPGMTSYTASSSSSDWATAEEGGGREGRG